MSEIEDRDLEGLIVHYDSEEYRRQSGGGWRTHAALLELREFRAAKSRAHGQAVDLALSYAAGGDSHPLHANTTTKRATAVIALSGEGRALSHAEAEAERLQRRADELERAIGEWIAANDAPARSGNRGETSAWLARTSDAERALRGVVGGEIRFPLSEVATLSDRAQQLEVKVVELNSELARTRAMLEAAQGDRHDP